MKVNRLTDLQMRPRFVQVFNPFAPREVLEDGSLGDYIKPISVDDLMFGPDGKPVGFMLAPLKSKTMREASLQLAREAANATEEELKDPGKITSHEEKLFAASVIGWSHDEVFGKYSPERAQEVIADPASPYLKQQIREALVKEQDFFGA